MSVSERETSARVSPHSFAAKAMHWGFIGVFVFAVTKQLDEVVELEDFSLLQYEMAFASNRRALELYLKQHAS